LTPFYLKHKQYQNLVLINLNILFCIFFANWHSQATLTEDFPCFFLSCKANARVYLAKDGARSALFLISELFCSRWYVFFVCKCVVYYCHWVSTQLQLIIYHIIYQNLESITVRTGVNLFHVHISLRFSIQMAIRNE
jgi:hypothetical protein